MDYRYFLIAFFILFFHLNTQSQKQYKDFKVVEIKYCYDKSEFITPIRNENLWKKFPLDSVNTKTDSLGFNLLLPEFDSFRGFGKIRIKLIPNNLSTLKLWRINFHIPFELYLNQNLIYQNGLVSLNKSEEKYFLNAALPCDFIINKIDTNILEVKFSGHSKLITFPESFKTWGLNLYPVQEDIISDKIEQIKQQLHFSWYSMFFFTLFLTFLIIYLFYPKNLNYLYFSLFNFFIGLSFFTTNLMKFYIPHNFSWEFIDSISAAFVLSLLFIMPVNMFFADKKNLKTLVYAIAGIICIPIIINPFLSSKNILLNYEYIIVALAAIFLCVIIIKAIKQKKSGAKIIGFGLVFPILIIIIALLIGMISSHLFHFRIDKYLDIIVPILPLSIPLSMATYLAREMALNNRNLERQLIEIKMLSEENLAREIEKQKMIAERNEILEIQVKERTFEILQQKEEIQTQNELLIHSKEEIEAQNEEILTQRDILFKQKKDIVDSINYASKIQSALLPDGDAFSELFPEFFVLFKPRNIVSGDFYWLKKIDQYTVIAVADCTGHGVPGAFMSMLGISFLNEIVSRNNFSQTGFILDQLRNLIKQTLKQNNPLINQKDGMDIVLIAINHENLELQYSGAYNSLYVLRQTSEEIPIPNNNRIEQLKNENTVLIEFKADRQPVAIHIAETEFTTQTFQLMPGDVLYANSDGYADQVGGKNHKKYLKKNYKMLLSEICTKPLAEQKTLLNQNIESWQRGCDQIDDILIVGIKV